MKAEVTGGFWARRMAANRNAIAFGRHWLEDVGSLANLRIAAGEQTGTPVGVVIADGVRFRRRAR